MRPFEGIYTPAVQVPASLKSGHRDYCYSARDRNDILQAIKNTNLSVVWEDCYNKYNEYDYTVFIPARYRYGGKNSPLIKGLCYNKAKIPTELECKIIEENRTHLIKKAGEEAAGGAIYEY